MKINDDILYNKLIELIYYKEKLVDIKGLVTNNYFLKAKKIKISDNYYKAILELENMIYELVVGNLLISSLNQSYNIARNIRIALEENEIIVKDGIVDIIIDMISQGVK